MKDIDDRRRWIAIGVVLATFAVMGSLMYFMRGSGIWCRVPTGAMVPTIPIGAHTLMDPWAYRSAPPKRGDIVIHRGALDQRILFVKRVVGLPGEVIQIRDKVVFIDGKPLLEPYVLHDDDTIFPDNALLPEPYRSRDQFGPYHVAPSAYFLMGDNRDYSSDSRYLGSVPRSLILGRIVRVFP